VCVCVCVSRQHAEGRQQQRELWMRQAASHRCWNAGCGCRVSRAAFLMPMTGGGRPPGGNLGDGYHRSLAGGRRPERQALHSAVCALLPTASLGSEGAPTATEKQRSKWLWETTEIAALGRYSGSPQPEACRSHTLYSTMRRWVTPTEGHTTSSNNSRERVFAGQPRHAQREVLHHRGGGLAVHQVAVRQGILGGWGWVEGGQGVCVCV
jgi:hypothetical protein